MKSLEIPAEKARLKEVTGFVLDFAEKLGFDKKQAKYGSVDTTYRHYFGVDPEVVNQHTPEILFDIDPPEWANKK